jgi:peptide/nickel transport system substrate-binding protein
MKKKFYMIISILLCTVLTGCTSGISVFSTSSLSSSKAASSKSTSSSQAYTKNNISLPYALNKSMNPFTADSMVNLMLWPLMYDCLSRPDENFKPVNVLASSVENKGNTVTCKLVNAKFTDGSAVKADDVKYSFTLAMNNGAGYFYSRVSNISGISTPNTTTVVFSLKKPDPLFANMLDVPVIKASSDKPPQTQLIGSGKYVFSKNGNNAVLSVNKGWFGNKTPQVTSIQLIDMPDDASIAQSLEIGSLDYVLSDYGTGTPMSVSLGSHSMNLNQIVYIGLNSVNPTNPALLDAHVRKAISLLIDRNGLVKDVYSSHALAAVLPFNPAWSAAPKAADGALNTSADKAAAELALAGYTSKNSGGVYQKTQGSVTTSLDFTILVNSDDNVRLTAAGRIATSLKNSGFNITIKQVDFATYSASVAAASFDMYFGELKLADNMSLAPFFTAGSAVSAGVAQQSSFYTAFTAYENNNSNLDAAAAAFTNETPFIPLCFKIGTVAYPLSFFSNIITTNHDLYYNIENWK